MARQATGPNEHPSTPTFLQVYKMLSIYSLLKPPKTGNCKILEPSIHTISINDLHCVVNNDDVTQRVKKIEILNSLITIDVGLEEIFDTSIHNYYKSEVEDCVLYYICGYMTKNLTKNIQCNVCLTAIAGMYLFIHFFFFK